MTEPDPRPTAAAEQPERMALDRHTTLVQRSLGVPVALITRVETDRQIFASAMGLPDPWQSRGETPLSHSFCRNCVSHAAPFVVDTAPNDPRVCDNPAIEDLGVVAYLGVPLLNRDRSPFAVLCAIADAPRVWTPGDIETMELLARNVEIEYELTERLAAETAIRREAEALVETRSRLLTTINHEVRNPLNGIFGALELLRNRPGPGRIDHYLEIIDRAARMLLNITEDALALERVGVPGEPSENIGCCPEAVVREVVDLSVCKAANSGVGLRCETAPRLPTSWPCPGRPVAQVLLNLIDNAIKFSDGGEVVISTEATPDRLVFRVTDEGPGIPRQDWQRIFERYGRSAARATRGQPSHGLGLAICSDIGARLGAVLRIETSRSPGGTTFFFSIPHAAMPAPSRVHDRATCC
ncbi:MAG: ATP-binding protein [Paracoccaceae bacterium]